MHVRIHLLLANSIGINAKYHNIPVKRMFYLFKRVNIVRCKVKHELRDSFMPFSLGKRKAHYLFEDGNEMAEEYDLKTDELVCK